MTLIPNEAGGYHFLRGMDAFSEGVVALPGYEIVRVTLHNPRPYQQGLDIIERHLTAQGRPLAALCATELRSPRPFSFAGFAAFNQEYQQALSRWDLLVEGQNPIARTNVAPAVRPPTEALLYAFSYTRPTHETDAPATFVVAGAGELRSRELAPENIVRFEETSPDALREKAAQVMYIMSQRLNGLRVAWTNAMAAFIYTVHPLQPFLVTEILDIIDQACVHGVHWYYSRPPVEGIEFEMDIRALRHEIRLE